MINVKEILEGCYSFSYKRLEDDRGWFSRTYSQDDLAKLGFTGSWVQHNHTYTAQKGTIRGMHYQLPPFAETKLVRCIAGNVYDVVIDLRKTSKTFLSWTSVELSAKEGNMILIPQGFAHGFQTMTDNCEMVYCHSEFYKPGAEAGILYNDPLTGIQWPLEMTKISERDKSHSLLTKEFEGINI